MTERERLIEIINNTKIRSRTLGDLFYKSLIEKIADHLLANGIIVPPVKVGQTVYYIGGIYNGTRPIRIGTIEGIVITPKGVSELWINGRNGIYYLKTAKENFYLTKKEALKALKGADK